MFTFSMDRVLPDGRKLTTTLSGNYGDLDSNDAWWLWEEAQQVCAKAERGNRAITQVSAVFRDIDFRDEATVAEGGRPPLVRTFAADGPGAEEAMQFDAQLNNWLAIGENLTHTPLAMTLTHVFAPAPRGAAGEQPLPFQLRTLLARVLHRSLLPFAFPSGAEPTLSPPEHSAGGAAIDDEKHLRAWSEITLGDPAAPGARPMTLEELAAAPAHLRAAIRAARAQQLLWAAATCVRSQWLGGLRALAPTARILLDEDATAALDALLERIDAGGDDAEALTPARAQAQIERAEGLEARGRFSEAAELYKDVLSWDMRQPELRLIRLPPLVWQYLGIAYKRDRDFPRSLAAFEAGLARLADASKPVQPEGPEWREHLRLTLLTSIVGELLGDPNCDFDEARRHEITRGALQRMFRREIVVLGRAGEQTDMFYNPGTNGYMLEGKRTRRRFALAARPPPPAQSEGTAERFLCVVEIARGPLQQAPGAPRDPPPGPLLIDLVDDPRGGGFGLGGAAHLAARAGLPEMPAAVCASCRKPPPPAGQLKVCSLCKGPRYCSVECQRAHWKAGHKQECAGGSSSKGKQKC